MKVYEDDGVRRECFELCESLGTGGGDNRGMSFGGEECEEEFTHDGVVVDDEDSLWRGGHFVR
jgi:hypothetical protein